MELIRKLYANPILIMPTSPKVWQTGPDNIEYVQDTSNTLVSIGRLVYTVQFIKKVDIYYIC